MDVTNFNFQEARHSERIVKTLLNKKMEPYQDQEWHFTNGRWAKVSPVFHPTPEHGVAFFLHSWHCSECHVDSRKAHQLVVSSKANM